MNDTELDRITIFVMEHSTHKDFMKMRDQIEKHFFYNTALVEYNSVGELIAFCRWNIILDGKAAVILDLVVRPDYRHMGLLQQMAKRGLKLWNEVEEFIYERQYDGDYHKPMKKHRAIKFTRRMLC